MGVGSCLACAFLLAAPTPAAQDPLARRVRWLDVVPFHAALRAGGLGEASFDAYVERTHAENLRRVHEGDLDHLVYYLLQSAHASRLPPIEPALSAKSYVERLEPPARAAFLRGDAAPPGATPADVEARIAALVKAIESPAGDARLTYFRSLVHAAFPEAATRRAGLAREYARVMRFVYEKEFVAQRAEARAESVAELYRRRGLSTDTAVEAGYVVHLGLGILQALQPGQRIRRVLIVGPGLDLAPRTGLREAAPPESYQPWAVIDALVSTGLSRADDLQVTAADINPRVVEHLRRAASVPPVLTLISDVAEGSGVTLSADYRAYFRSLGAAVAAAPVAGDTTGGHLRKTIRVGAAAARALRAEPLDIVTERLTGAPFDLVIATNILPYFDDRQLALAVANIASMIAPGGAFLHNEARPLLGELSAAVGVPFQQSRHAVIATVKGADAPLFDSVFLHLKAR